MHPGAGSGNTGVDGRTLVEEQMPRRTMQLLVAGILAGGCSRDAPLVAPDLESAEATVASPGPLAAKDKKLPVADVVDDALQRLVPSLGDYGIPLRAPLLALQARPSDPAAWAALRRALEAIGSTVPEQYQPDLDALDLELEAVAPR